MHALFFEKSLLLSNCESAKPWDVFADGATTRWDSPNLGLKP